MVFGGAMGLVGAEKFIKQKGMLSKPSRHMVAVYGTSFLTAFVGKELGKIYGTKQNISKAVYSGHFQNTFPDGIWKDLTISFVTGQPFDSNKHQQGVEVIGSLHPDQMFFPSEEEAMKYRDYVQRNGLQSAATVARETRPDEPAQAVQPPTPVIPVNQYQSYSNLRYPQSATSNENEPRRNKWGDEIH